MSSFAIPPLSGGIQFDVSQFDAAMGQVANLAAAFPGQIAEHIDAPMEQTAEHMGQSAEHAGKGLHHGIQDGLLGAEAAMQLFPPLVIELIESPVLGAVAAVKEAMHSMFDVVSETANHFESINVAAITSGLDPKTFSTFAAAAKATGVEIGTFTAGLELMQFRAADALRGDEGAAKGFYELGISAKQLTEGLRDPKALLLQIADAMKGLEPGGARIQASMDALGRGGKAMIPFLEQGSDGITALAQHLGDLGAAVGESEAQTGAAWTKMTAEFSAMWEGVKAAVAEPIFEFLSQNIGEINVILHDFSEEMGGAVVDAVKELVTAFPPIIGAMASFGELIETVTPILEPFVELMVELANALKLIVDTLQLVSSAADMVGDVLMLDPEQFDKDRARAGKAKDKIMKDLGWDDDDSKAPVTIHNHLNVNADEMGQHAGREVAKVTRQTFEQYQRSLAANAKHAKVAGNMGRRGH